VTLKERSFALATSIFHYYTTERARLFPALAFEGAGMDLLRLVGALPPARPPAGRYERWLCEDIEALAFVSIPQLPSSRLYGSAPAGSIEEYRSRTPHERSKWKTIPLERRPFPADLATRRPLTSGL
jgi:hypothetical protein